MHKLVQLMEQLGHLVLLLEAVQVLNGSLMVMVNGMLLKPTAQLTLVLIMDQHGRQIIMFVLQLIMLQDLHMVMEDL